MKKLINISLVLFCIGLTPHTFSQVNNHYLNYSEYNHDQTRLRGCFDDDNNFYVGRADAFGVRFYKFDSNQIVIESQEIINKYSWCFLNKVLYANDKVYATFQQHLGSFKYSFRLVILSKDLDVLLDSTHMDTVNGNGKFTTDMILNTKGEIVFSATHESNRGRYVSFNKISEWGMVETKKFLNLDYAYSLSNYDKNKYLVSTGQYRDTAMGRIYSNVALILDSSFNLIEHFQVDSSLFYFDNGIDRVITYYPENGFLTAREIDSHNIAVIGGLSIDTHYYWPINNIHVVGTKHFNVSIYNPNRILKYERIFSDSNAKALGMHSPFTNSAQFKDGSFLAFALSDADPNLTMTSLRSSYSLSKFDKTGQFLWTKTYSNKNRYYLGTEVVVSNSGRIALIGVAYDFNDTKINYGHVLFLDNNGDTISTVGLPNIAADEKSHVVYPNPAKREITFKCQADYSELRVYNSNGVLVLEKIITKIERLNIENYPTGIYFYTVQGKNKLESGKFVKVE